MAGRPERTAPRRGAAVAQAGPPSALCDLCGATTLEVRCKIVCRRCGYTRDCSDP